MVFRGETIGLFHVANKPTDYGEKDKRLLEAIAGHVAPILHARLQSERRRQELERHSDRLAELVEEQTAGLRSANEALLREVTEHKQAEEALQESVRLLRDTGEMATVGGWELDLSTKEVSWTEEVGRIHGVEPGYKPKLEEALDFYAPESRPAVEAAVKKAAETGEPYDLESLLIPLGSKDRIWVRSPGKAVYSGGRIVKLAGTFQNIEKYRRAEEALRESESRFRQVLELSTDLIYRLDFESRTYDYVSPSVLCLSGLTEKEFAALGIHGIRHRVHPEDWPQYEQRLEKLLQGCDGTATRHEYRWQCKDGQYRWFTDCLP
jgi:PAS domain S-box-containing protein